MLQATDSIIVFGAEYVYYVHVQLSVLCRLFHTSGINMIVNTAAKDPAECHFCEL